MQMKAMSGKEDVNAPSQNKKYRSKDKKKNRKKRLIASIVAGNMSDKCVAFGKEWRKCGKDSMGLTPLVKNGLWDQPCTRVLPVEARSESARVAWCLQDCR